MTTKVYNPKQHSIFPTQVPERKFYTIEQNVPIPSLYRRGKPITPEAAAKRAALASMRIGDSIAFEDCHRSAFATARASVQRGGKKKFTTRRVGLEFGQKIYRVWRTN